LNFAFVSFLGFTMLQFVFALTARSDAMLADCAAMTVDAITYLFNYAAERMKHKLEYSTDDDDEDDEEDYEENVGHNNPQTNRLDKRELQRLLLELIPPSVSASTLVVVTIMTMKQSIHTILLTDDDTNKQAPPDVMIMLIFSALNLVLDGMNVLEFSRVDHVVLSITHVHHEHSHPYHHHSSRRHREKRCHHYAVAEANEDTSSSPTEATELLSRATNESMTMPDKGDTENNNITKEDDDASSCSSESDLNLNMCSAWTHIAADTLRSVAVLLAASFSAMFPQLLSPMDADSIGAILVSIVILVSLFPLLQGIFNTALEIRKLVLQRDNNNANGR